MRPRCCPSWPSFSGWGIRGPKRVLHVNASNCAPKKMLKSQKSQDSIKHGLPNYKQPLDTHASRLCTTVEQHWDRDHTMRINELWFRIDSICRRGEYVTYGEASPPVRSSALLWPAQFTKGRMLPSMADGAPWFNLLTLADAEVTMVRH